MLMLTYSQNSGLKYTFFATEKCENIDCSQPSNFEVIEPTTDERFSPFRKKIEFDSKNIITFDRDNVANSVKK